MIGLPPKIQLYFVMEKDVICLYTNVNDLFFSDLNHPWCSTDLPFIFLLCLVCYNVKQIPEDEWYCQRCEYKKRKKAAVSIILLCSSSLSFDWLTCYNRTSFVVLCKLALLKKPLLQEIICMLSVRYGIKVSTQISNHTL